MTTRRDIRQYVRRSLKGQRVHLTRARFRKIAQRAEWRPRGPSLIMPVVRRRTNGRVFSIERKFHDVDIDDAVIANTGLIFNSVNLIPQGVTETTRVGRKANISAINWRFDIILPEADGVADPPNIDVIRVILFLDKQANGATAAVTDILESADYQSFNNLANKSRFRTLMDRTYNMNRSAGGGNGTTSDWGAERHSDTFFKRCNIPIEFDSTAGAITEIRSNNIGVLLISQNGNAGFESKMRLRFTDL